MARLKVGETHLRFFCPGCQCNHRVPYADASAGREGWDWNGSAEEPTLLPSLVYNADDPQTRCHSFVREGKIQFLDDCHHALKGQTVNLPDWE